MDKNVILGTENLTEHQMVVGITSWIGQVLLASVFVGAVMIIGTMFHRYALKRNRSI